MISEYDMRQINLMKERIEEYRNNKIYIHRLIGDLEALLHCLEGVDSQWKEKFMFAWDILEIEYASALFNNKKFLDDDAISEINRGLKEIDKLIENLLKNGKESDSLTNHD